MNITIHKNNYMVQDEDGRLGLSEEAIKGMTPEGRQHTERCLREVLECLIKNYVRWDVEEGFPTVNA